MLRLAILAILILVALAFLAREILTIGQERRAGAEEKPLYRRFRRRAKGLLLLIVLYISAAFYDELAAFGHFDAQANLLFMGGILIIMIWILIIAARDFRESALAIVRENEQMTRETLQSLEEEMRRRKGKDGNE